MRVKRIVATLTAGIDSFVNKIENHEGVADSLIADVRTAAARLRTQTARVKQQQQHLGAAKQNCVAQCEKWKARARRLKSSNPDDALQCMRHLAQEEQRLVSIDAQLAEHDRLVNDLNQSLQDVESRLEKLRLKRTALVSRSTRADVIIKTNGPGLTDTLDEVFERWEESVFEKEYHEQGPIGTATDSFEQAFLNEEETARLQSRLDQLGLESEDE